MIIITGASRGIGRYLLESYLQLNAEPVIGTFLSTPPASLNDSYIKLDVRDYMQVEEFVNKQKPQLRRLTLINCAGITYNAFSHKSDVPKWQEVIETNLFGAFNMIRAMLPLMRDEHFGRIINFSSVVAVKPTPGVSSYAASKSALWGLSRSIAVENAALDITINNINMGYSQLGMIHEVPENFLKNIIGQIPASRLCEGQDILNTVEFLRTTGYVTGTSIDLSGGLV